MSFQASAFQNSAFQVVRTPHGGPATGPAFDRVYRPNRTHEEGERRLRAFSEVVDLLEAGATKTDVKRPTLKEIKVKARSLEEGDDRRQILELLDRISAVQGANARKREQLIALHTAYRIEAELQARLMDDEEAILVLLLSE